MKLQPSLIALLLALLTDCTPQYKVTRRLASLPDIFPDYCGVTVPQQIAPLHFRVNARAGEAVGARFVSDNGEETTVSASDGSVCISRSRWQALLDGAGKVTVEVMVKQGDAVCAYRPFDILVSPDPIDPYIAYRKIEPGYTNWYKMGLYQRQLSTFDEEPLVENTSTGNNCINCHTFCQADPRKMAFHMRGEMAGTWLLQGDGRPVKCFAGNDTVRSLVYPSWHPSGRFIAYSTNDTHQTFHSSSANRIEVFDEKSDIVVLDLDPGAPQLFSSPLIATASSWETYPCFSPDGKTLYFCTADSVAMPQRYKEVKYSICSIAFDAAKKKFGDRVDTLLSARTVGKSMVMPRVSPDGKWMVVTVSDYGCFPIWHHEADLYIVNLRTRAVRPLAAANSRDTESYHSWSSNGRWLLFASRRVNGLYTMPYLCHIAPDGRASKPFLLPQDDTDYYDRCLKSYNIPEFVKGKIHLSTPR